MRLSGSSKIVDRRRLVVRGGSRTRGWGVGFSLHTGLGRATGKWVVALYIDMGRYAVDVGFWPKPD